MQDQAPSLWRQIPLATRIELVPIVSTALLVQAGPTTAELIVRFNHLTAFRAPVNPASLEDVTGILLLLNFAIVFWFGWCALRDALAKTGDVSVNAKLIGLATAVLTLADLYSYATKGAHPERLAFGLPLLFYAFVVPFFVVRPLAGLREPTHEATQDRRVAVHAAGAIELLLSAIVPCVGTVLACSLYFAVLNDGLSMAGAQVIPSLVASVLGQAGRAEFWGFSPGVLGIGWLPAVLATGTFEQKDPDPVTLGIRGRGTAVLLAGTLAICAVLGICLISDGDLILGAAPPESSAALLLGAKAVLGIAVPCAFLGAFSLARAVDRRSLERWVAIPLQAIGFALAGGVIGLIVSGLRMWLGGTAPFAYVLAAMHAGGFVLAYLAGLMSIRALRKRLPDISPVLTA